MADLDTLSWYALGIPVYLLVVCLEIWLSRRRGVQAFGFAEGISNLSAGLGTLVIGLFAGPWVLKAWNFAHDHVAPFPWPEHGWWKFPAALLLSDFCYYIYHRAGHRHAIFWSIHGIHHQHEHLNSSVGFRLEWLADPYAALFFGLMPLAGVDAGTGFFAIAILSLYTLTAHTPVLARPTLGVLITPAIHGTHHSRDARFSEKNYGAMLGIWDRLFGTWKEPEPDLVMRSDVPSISRTHDAVSSQFGLIAELVRKLARTPTLGAKLRMLYARPTHSDEPSPTLRRDDEIPMATRVYVLVQFVALVVLAAWLLWFRGHRPLPVQLVSAATIVFGLHSLGRILDGRSDAALREAIRLAVTAAVGGALWLHEPLTGVVVAALALAGLAAHAVVVPRGRASA